MNDKLSKLMEKKKGAGEMDPMHKAAKMSMLESLRNEMSGMMKGDLNGDNKMHSVEVAAPDKEGLAAGLDKAKDMVGDPSTDADELNSGDDMKDGSEGAESGDMSQDNGDEAKIADEVKEDDLTPEEIDQLMALLAKMKGSK